MTVICAAHYAEAVAALAADPIVIDMAAGLTDVCRIKLASADGTPHWDLMRGANDEYAKRGGKGVPHQHIGAVAEALLSILDHPDPDPAALDNHLWKEGF